MSLKLKLKPKERMIINGSIVRNPSNRRIELEVENYSDVLRGSEMLDAATADTPVKKICYLIQIAIVSRAHRETVLGDIKDRLADVRKIMNKSHGDSLDEIITLVDGGHFYHANRKLQDIVNYEAVLLGLPRKGVFLASSNVQDAEDLITEKAS